MKLNEVVPNSCRVCLKRTPRLRSLYNPLDEGEEPPNEMLHLIAGVELEMADVYETLPKCICKPCELSLCLAYQFRAKVLRTHQLIEIYRKQFYASNATETNNAKATSVKDELDDWTNSNQSNEESYINEDHIHSNKEMRFEVLELSFTDIEAIDMDDEEQGTLELNEYEEINDGCKPEYLDETEVYSDEEAPSLHTTHPQTTAPVQKKEAFNYDDFNEISDDDSIIEVTVKEEIMSAKTKSDENYRGTSTSPVCTIFRENFDQAGKQNKRRSPTKVPINNKEKVISSEYEADTLAPAEKSTRKDNSNAAHICDICGNIYAKRGRMMEHRRRHDKELRFACELCDKRFHLREKLRKHMFLHTGGKPYKCSFCSRTFFYESVKKAHEAVHSGVKPYVCDECNKAFAYAHALSKHKLIHADIKLYHCEYCGKDFRLQHHMKQHIETKLHQNAVRVAQMALAEGKSVEELPASPQNT